MIGIKETVKAETKKYYETNYDLLRTPNFDERYRLLSPKYGKQEIGNPVHKICRFCGKTEKKVSFKKIAHAFPESVGNNILFSNYECDVCNQLFGNTIENEYAKFFNLYHSIMQISGKNGKPKCNYKVPCKLRSDKCAEYCINILFNDEMPKISVCKNVDNQYVKISNDAITISKPLGKCCPIAVFKALVKMAITIMPIEEVNQFQTAIKWLLDQEHENIYNNNKLLVRYQMIPGFSVTKYPHYCLYRRKRTVWNKPYMLFNLTYGCFSLFLQIPRDNDNFKNEEFEKMPFPPVPFWTSTEGIWNLSEKETKKNARQSIVLNFKEMNELK